jgi:hypothetical protein
MLKSALVVAAFWWCIVTAWGWLFIRAHHPGVRFDEESTQGYLGSMHVHYLIAPLALAVLGWLSEIYKILSFKKELFLSLLPSQKNGLNSSLGSASSFLHQEQMFTTTPSSRSISQTIFPILTKITPQGREFVQWVQTIHTHSPLHGQALLECLLIIIELQKLSLAKTIAQINNKSGPDCDLLSHSICVAISAKALALSYDYKGIVHHNSLIPRGDLNFKLSPQDPMIALISLCHDLGKVNPHASKDLKNSAHSLIYEGSNAARHLAKLDCIKKLPLSDQNALYFALTFYQRPSFCTLNIKAQVADDRSAALMMLLIEAHEIANNLKSPGKSLVNQDNA